MPRNLTSRPRRALDPAETATNGDGELTRGGLAAVAARSASGGPRRAKASPDTRSAPLSLGRTLVASWRSRAVVLCYHSVTDDAPPRLAKFSVSPRAFARQMGLLHRLGYRVVTLRELVETFEAGRPVGRCVALTFDDGYLDTCTVAAPILADYGFRATVFVVTDRVGQTAEWDAASGGGRVPLATWEQLRALRDSGWEIGLHSATHADLPLIPVDALSREIGDARRSLEGALGEPVHSLAYPYGNYSSPVIDAARQAGLRVAAAAPQSMASARSPRFALPRSMIRRSDSLPGFLFILLTGYRIWTLGYRACRWPFRAALHGRQRPQVASVERIGEVWPCSN